MNIVDPKVESYIEEKIVNQESKLLEDLRRETFQKTIQPYMISGIYQGRLLSLISKIINPKTILEIGTFTGYSTLCLAEGLQNDGKVITIDKNKELEFISQKYFKQSEYNNSIEYHAGNAQEIIPQLNDSFDLIFLDADKKSYSQYFDMVIEKMPSGGIILADNVLWYGKVLEKAEVKDEDTIALQKFNIKIQIDSRVEHLILPIRDGISLIRKK